MKFTGKVILGVLVISAAVSCKSQFDALLSSNDVDAKYKAAFELFNKGKYQKAASLFESMSVLTDGTERDDTVQYYWGLSNYRFKDYVTAEANFTRFVTNFPRSPFAENARFLRIDCLYRSTYRTGPDTYQGGDSCDCRISEGLRHSVSRYRVRGNARLPERET